MGRRALKSGIPEDSVSETIAGFWQIWFRSFLFSEENNLLLFWVILSEKSHEYY